MSPYGWLWRRTSFLEPRKYITIDAYHQRRLLQHVSVFLDVENPDRPSRQEVEGCWSALRDLIGLYSNSWSSSTQEWIQDMTFDFSMASHPLGGSSILIGVKLQLLRAPISNLSAYSNWEKDCLFAMTSFSISLSKPSMSLSWRSALVFVILQRGYQVCLTLEFNYLVGFCAPEPILASKDNAIVEG